MRPGYCCSYIGISLRITLLSFKNHSKGGKHRHLFKPSYSYLAKCKKNKLSMPSSRNNFELNVYLDKRPKGG